MGRPKPLLPWDGTTVIGAVVDSLLGGGVHPVVVVVAEGGQLAERVGAELAARGGRVRLARNPRPEEGMLSSVLAGLAALGGGRRLARTGTALCVCPADHPAIRAATVERLVAAAAGGGGGGIWVPRWRGRRGHPLVVTPDLVPEVEGLDPAVGLRQLLARRAGRVVEVEVDDAGVVRNLNTPASYERARRDSPRRSG